MRIFKFGGASVRDAAGIRNVYDVLQKTGHDDVLLIVSAMGKTTNALEAVVNNYTQKSPSLQASIQEVKKYHNQILLELFEDESHPVFAAIDEWFTELDRILKTNKSPNYNFVYDQIVSLGEMISTTILSHCMSFRGIQTAWLDVRNFIKTDST